MVYPSRHRIACTFDVILHPPTTFALGPAEAPSDWLTEYYLEPDNMVVLVVQNIRVYVTLHLYISKYILLNVNKNRDFKLMCDDKTSGSNILSPSSQTLRV